MRTRQTPPPDLAEAMARYRLEWLLDPADPSVRYWALQHLKGLAPDHPDVLGARAAVMASPTVAAIFALQGEDGRWVADEELVRPMYRSTLWMLLLLAEFGADGADPRIRRGVEALTAQMGPDGAVMTRGAWSGDLDCIHGLTLRALLLLGYHNHPTVAASLRFLLERFLREQGRCKFRQGLSCPWGTTKLLLALAALPPAAETDLTRAARAAALGFLGAYDLAEAAYPRRKTRSRHWYQFGFPRNYQSDVLEVLDAMASAGGAWAPSLAPAVELVRSKRLPDGRWKMEDSLDGKFPVPLERRGRPSKWLTLRALRVLRWVDPQRWKYM